MSIETIYSADELEPGECKSCCEVTDIIPHDGRCPDCIEEQKFIAMTMQNPYIWDFY